MTEAEVNAQQPRLLISREVKMLFLREKSRISEAVAKSIFSSENNTSLCVQITKEFSGGFEGRVWVNQLERVRELLPGWFVNPLKETSPVVSLAKRPVPKSGRQQVLGARQLTA